MEGVAAAIQELVRTLLFFKALEIIHYHAVQPKQSKRKTTLQGRDDCPAAGYHDSSLFLTRVAVFTIGAVRNDMTNLLQTACIFKLLECIQQTMILSYPRQRQLQNQLQQQQEKYYCTAFISAFTRAFVSALDPIAPREMFLLGTVASQERSETVNVRDPCKLVVGSGLSERIRTCSEGLPCITEENSEDDGYDCDFEDQSLVLLADKDTEYCHGRRERKKVRFSVSRIAVFDMVIGDNPSVSSGPPVQIAWKPSYYLENAPLQGDDYSAECNEEDIFRTCLVRRMSAEQRHHILLSGGCTEAEIAKAMILVELAHKKRCHTIQHMNRQARHERRERVKDRILSFCCSSSKQQEISLQHDRHEPFLSIPRDLEGRRAGQASLLCRDCAQRFLEDTSKDTTWAMYHRRSLDCAPFSSNRNHRNTISRQSKLKMRSHVEKGNRLQFFPRAISTQSSEDSSATAAMNIVKPHPQVPSKRQR